MCAWVAPAIAAGSSIFSALNNSAPQNGYSSIVANAAQNLNNINVPTPQEMAVTLQQYVQQGLITPQQYQAAIQSSNPYNSISTNPANEAAQQQSLAALQQQIAGGGLDAIQKSNLLSTNNQLNASNQSYLNQVLSQAARQGNANSGATMGAALQGNAQARNQAYQQGMDSAAQAEAAKNQEIQSQATIGGQLQNEQYTQGANQAQAQQAMNTANQNAQNTAAQYNTTAANNAQGANLNAAQSIANANTDQSNSNALRNSNLQQQQFQDQVQQQTAALQPTENAAMNAQNIGNSAISQQNSLFNNGAGAIGNAANQYYKNSQVPQYQQPSSQPIGNGNSTPTGSNNDPSNYGINYSKGGTIKDILNRKC